MPKDNDAAVAASSGDKLSERVETLEKAFSAGVVPDASYDRVLEMAHRIDALERRLAALEQAFPISAKQAPKTRSPE